MGKLYPIVIWLWQLPQNLLGLLLIAIYREERVYHRLNGRSFYWTSEMPSGISLGNYIILSRVDYGNTLKHEYGHSIQSRYLGPLYLFIIGLPSLLGNIFDRLFHRNWAYSSRVRWYYSQPWESWADKLGKVKRHEE